MRVHAVPATITVAPEAQFADDRANGDLVLFQRRSAGSCRPVSARQFVLHKDFAAEIEELYR